MLHTGPGVHVARGCCAKGRARPLLALLTSCSPLLGPEACGAQAHLCSLALVVFKIIHSFIHRPNSSWGMQHAQAKDTCIYASGLSTVNCKARQPVAHDPLCSEVSIEEEQRLI